MNCEQAQALIPEHAYGAVSSTQQQELRHHLATCPACTETQRSLESVRQALDAAPLPAVHVDLAALYRRAAELAARRQRRWRRLAWATSAAAALLLVFMGLRFELRWNQGQLVVGWGLPPEPAPPPVLVQQLSAASPELLAELQLVRDLVHAIAADVEQRDQQRLEALIDLERRLDAVTTVATQRWTVTQNDVRALYTAYLGIREKGASP